MALKNLQLAIGGLGLATAAPLTAQDTEAPAGEIHELRIPAPSLAGNLVGSPTEQFVQVYLPPSYENSDQRYPVLYLLHGFHGTDRTWMKDLDAPARVRTNDSPYQDYGLITAEWLDAKFLEEDYPEMIIVAPNGRNAFKHSFWMNGEVTGRWSDYVVDDVVGYIDANFRTLAQRESRGIAGHSGGGHGSIRIAMLHPDIFNSVYAMAPCCLGPDEASHTMDMGASEDGSMSETAQLVFSAVEALESVDDLPGSSGARPNDFNVNAEVAVASVYSPNAAKAPFFGDFAFNRHDGALTIDQSVLDRRSQRYAYNVLDDRAEALRSLDGFMIDTGELEFDTLRKGAGSFVEKLAQHQVPVRFEVYADGNHGNLFVPRMMTIGLDFFAAHLAAEMKEASAE